MHVCTYVRMYVCLQHLKDVCMYVCLYACVHICILIYIYTYIEPEVSYASRFYISGGSGVLLGFGFGSGV